MNLKYFEIIQILIIKSHYLILIHVKIKLKKLHFNLNYQILYYL